MNQTMTRIGLCLFVLLTFYGTASAQTGDTVTDGILRRMKEQEAQAEEQRRYEAAAALEAGREKRLADAAANLEIQNEQLALIRAQREAAERAQAQATPSSSSGCGHRAELDQFVKARLTVYASHPRFS